MGLRVELIRGLPEVSQGDPELLLIVHTLQLVEMKLTVQIVPVPRQLAPIGVSLVACVSLVP